MKLRTHALQTALSAGGDNGGVSAGKPETQRYQFIQRRHEYLQSLFLLLSWVSPILRAGWRFHPPSRERPTSAGSAAWSRQLQLRRRPREKKNGWTANGDTSRDLSPSDMKEFSSLLTPQRLHRWHCLTPRVDTTFASLGNKDNRKELILLVFNLFFLAKLTIHLLFWDSFI